MVFFRQGQYQAKREVPTTTQAPLSLSIDRFDFFFCGSIPSEEGGIRYHAGPLSLSIDPFFMVIFRVGLGFKI